MSDEANRKPHRQICSLCNNPCRVGFWVPNGVWKQALHPSQWDEMLCLECFTKAADERLVQWDSTIVFHPISLATFLIKSGGMLER